MSRILKVCHGLVFFLVLQAGSWAAAQDSVASRPSGAMRIKAGTKLMLDLDSPLNSATTRIDDVVWFTSRNDLKVDGRVALYRGTPIRGSVVAVKPAIVNGKNQRTEIRVQLEEIPLAEGGSLAIAADTLKVQGEKIGPGVAQNTIGQAAQGAMLGGTISRSAKEAGIGAAAAVGISILTGVLSGRGPSSDVDLPAGSIFEAKLERPLDISDPKMLAKAVPRPPASTPPDSGPTPSSGNTQVAVSLPDQSTPESSDTPRRSVPAFGDLAADAEPDVAKTDSESVPATPSPDSARDSGSSDATISAATLKVEVNLVQVDAIVRDRAGRPMGNLRQEDFRILEDGVEQRIQFFSRDKLPLAVALVIDRSGSVAPLMHSVQTAAYQALQLLKAGDRVSLFAFAGSVEMLEELTTNRQRVANRIGSIQAGGGTAIVDAVTEAMRYLSVTAPDSRRAVILISDNLEGRSAVPVDYAVELALETEAVVYSVKVSGAGASLFGLPGIPGIPGLPGRRFPGMGGAGLDPVPSITKESGGEIFDADGSSITSALSTAVDRLKLRYTLSYASDNSGAARSSKGGYHRIQVQLVSRFGKPDLDYSVHARSGYYDPQARADGASSRP